MILPDLKPFKSYLEAKGRSNKTIQNYENAVTQFLTYVNKQAQEVILEDIESYCRYMIKEYHSNTLTPKYGGVKAYFKFLKLKDLIEQCEDEDILKPPKWKIPEKVVLNKSEIQAIFKASEGKPRDNAIFKTLYYSTQRVSSVRDIKITDINFENEAVRIHGKGDRYYSVDLHPEAIQSIKEYLKVRPTPKQEYQDTLFLNEYGKGLTNVRIWQIAKDYGYKSGITKRVYPHLFRATAITHMDDSGMSLSQIKLQSGHECLDSLNTYIRPDKKKNKAKVREALKVDISTKPEQPQPRKKPEIPVDPNLKRVDKSTNTDNYIAKPQQDTMLNTLQQEIERLKAQLRDKENSYMYG